MGGCQNCCEAELFRTFSYLEEDYIPGATPAIEYDEELKICPVCEESLSENDYVVDDEVSFIEDSLKFLAQKINLQICECQYCNSTIIPYEQGYGDAQSLSTVNELVDSYCIPTHLIPKIYEYISCNCGNSPSPDDPYVSKEELDEWYGEKKKFIINTFNISGEDTIDFIDFLEEYPMLGLLHNVGKEIFEQIKNNTIPGVVTINPGDIYYRGRTRNRLQRVVPFVEEELWNPPVGVPNQGRFNPHGVSNLYLGDKESTILSEISPSNNDIVDIAEFEVTESLKVFNSTQTDIDIFAAMENEDNGFSSSYEYIFPNFLAQCLAYNNFKGILYKSVKDTSGLNLCLFNVIKDEEISMIKIHENANVDNNDFLSNLGFGLKRTTVFIEKKEEPFDLTDLF
ncbi:hypothetical protein AQ616_15805 [Oceanobacillus sp. E9]|nr:hypothetical protein AQ616_15805 [Oceanobacillus sp. E9]